MKANVKYRPGGSIQVGPVDEAELGIGPVKFLLLEVNGQSVGPIDFCLHDDLSAGTVHARPLYSRLLPPVGPVHVPEKRDQASVNPVSIRSMETTKQVV